MSKPEEKNSPSTPDNPSNNISIIINNIGDIYDYASERKYSGQDFDEFHSTTYLFQTRVTDNVLDGFVHLSINGSDYSSLNLPNEFNLHLELTRYTGPEYGHFDENKRYINEDYSKKIISQLFALGYAATYVKDTDKSQKIKFEKNGLRFILALGFCNEKDHFEWWKTTKNIRGRNGFEEFMNTSSTPFMHLVLENQEIKDEKLYKHFLPLTTKEEFSKTIDTFCNVSEHVIKALYLAYQEQIPNLIFTNENLVHNKNYKKTSEKQSDSYHATFKQSKIDTAIPIVNNINFSEILGQDEAVEEAKELVLGINHPEIFEKWGVKPSKAILFCGPTGTGKTMLIRAIASEINAEILNISCSEIGTKWYGESERNIQDVFNEANKIAKNGKKAIIVFDELDALAPSRENTHDQTDKRIVSVILQNLDGFIQKDVLVMATTNLLDNIDKAVLRPGRIDKIIEVGLPNIDGRKKILEQSIKKANALKTVSHDIFSSDLNIQRIAERTINMSGAELVEIISSVLKKKAVKESQGIRQSPITTEDIENTIMHSNRKKKIKIEGFTDN